MSTRASAVGFGWKYSSWKSAGRGPNTLTMTSLYFFKRGARRVEMKAGYIGNDLG